MISESKSPTSLVWTRLKRNVPALTGLIIILLATFISVFCYVLMPDKTPNANEMNLALATLKPMSSVTFLNIPNQKSSLENSNVLEQLFVGKVGEFRKIPIDTFYFSKNNIYYREFSGDSELEMPINVLSTANAFVGSDNYMMKNDTIIWKNENGVLFEKSVNELEASITNERITSQQFLLGTDRFGRDLLSRILAGTRVSMSVGLIAVIISLIIGVLLGAIAGFYRGKTDDFIMWLINVIWSIPTLLLVIAITLALGKGFAQVFIAVGLTMWVEVARVVRGQIFSLREMEFVEAGKALGFSNARIIFRHVLPNVLSPVIVIAASNFASAILLEAGLSFLGMGAQPPTPSWGMMIKENYGYIIVDAGYLAIFPGLAIMLMVLAFTWLGNGLRDAVDTKAGSGRGV